MASKAIGILHRSPTAPTRLVFEDSRPDHNEVWSRLHLIQVLQPSPALLRRTMVVRAWPRPFLLRSVTFSSLSHYRGSSETLTLQGFLIPLDMLCIYAFSKLLNDFLAFLSKNYFQNHLFSNLGFSEKYLNVSLTFFFFLCICLYCILVFSFTVFLYVSSTVFSYTVFLCFPILCSCVFLLSYLPLLCS